MNLKFSKYESCGGEQWIFFQIQDWIFREDIMSETKKVKETVKSVAGKAKETVGTGATKADGQKMQAEAKTDYKAQQAQQKTEGILQSTIGTIKDTIGGLLGQTQTQAEGKVDKTKGDVNQKLSTE